MASRDIDSLCTNIPLVENIVICIDSLYNDSENTNKILNVFGNLLSVTTKKSFFFFMFNNKFYKQIDGVVKGLHWGQL